MLTHEKTIAMAEKLDVKVGGIQGYPSNTLRQWLATLIDRGSVEVGWRESCGHTDLTLKVYREWLKIVKSLKRAGFNIVEERIKHKNGYASNNGGFWNSIIYSLNGTV